MKHILLALLLLPSFATAGPISFNGDWKDLTFRRFTPTQYAQQGKTLTITGKGTSSLLYTILSKADRDATAASWAWSASNSVPATKLDQEGGDDRNLALYFVFTDENSASKITQSSRPSRLMGRNSKVLVYAWGDNRATGSLVANPYNTSRGAIYLLRPAKTGSFSESRNLVADYTRAFGTPPGILVGIAVAADGDDTDTTLNSKLTGLTLN